MSRFFNTTHGPVAFRDARGESGMVPPKGWLEVPDAYAASADLVALVQRGVLVRRGNPKAQTVSNLPSSKVDAPAPVVAPAPAPTPAVVKPVLPPPVVEPVKAPAKSVQSVVSAKTLPKTESKVEAPAKTESAETASASNVPSTTVSAKETESSKPTI